MANIGFTGTQLGMTKSQTIRVANFLNPKHTLRHGDCLGADHEAHLIGAGMGMHICIHPPDNDSKRAFCDLFSSAGGIEVLAPKQYLERNRDIVYESDIILAVPKNRKEERRSGTWSTVRYARQAGKFIVVIFPLGNASIELPNGELRFVREEEMLVNPLALSNE